MALFGRKKNRTSRTATFRPTTSLAARWDERLRDRSFLVRLLAGTLAVVAVLCAVEGWRSPFPYRLGDRAEHGVMARVGFARVNRAETTRARANAEATVPFLFHHNPEPITGLPAQLRSSLGEVAKAESFEEVSPKTRLEFGLGTPDSMATDPMPMSESVKREFLTLKSALTVQEGSPGTRLDELVKDFEQLSAALEQYGVVAPEELARNEIRPDQTIAILTADGGNRRTAVARELLLTELIKETGQLGKSWVTFTRLTPIRPMLERWLLAQAPVTLHYDSQATLQERENARLSVPDVTDAYNKGDLLVAPGQVIDDEQLLGVLEAEYAEMERQVPHRQRVLRAVVAFLMLSVLAVLCGFYLARNERKLVSSPARLGIYLASIVLAVALGRMLSFDPWRAEVIPLTATVMVLAIAYNQVLATLTAFVMALVLTLSTVAGLGQFVVLMSVATTALIPLARVSSRSKLIKVGFWCGAVYFFVSWGIGIIQSPSPGEIWSDTALLFSSLRGAGWCLVTGYLVAGSLPFIESAFGVVTDISLLEMSDISHPILQELVRRAPGTYNHSITVAAIAESAADRIGANGLLVRVGAYFHDIGKMLKPQYFVENTTGAAGNRHEHLAPAMSTLIIIGHVKDGVDLARQHNLPQPLIDFIEQHHGTTLVEYFYHEATRQAEEQHGHRADAQESAFRYPGPKPQSREAGVMMLADAVESASRTLSEPTAKRLEGLVHSIMMKRLLDGQFDESSLTLSELHIVEDSLVKSLIGIYHGRIKYPEQRTA
jgi:putative nucleotidyltransferase with HDIG domain